MSEKNIKATIEINGETYGEYSEITLAKAIIYIMQLCIEHHQGVASIYTEEFNNASMIKKIEVVAGNGAVYDIDVYTPTYSNNSVN